MWEISKSFNFCYGHRVWTQELNPDFCENGDASCKCKHLHGHEGLVKVSLEGTKLNRGMVTDFKHLGWLKNFLDDYIDHKTILDSNDPLFSFIVRGDIWDRTPADRFQSVGHTANITKYPKILKCIFYDVPMEVIKIGDYVAGYKFDTSDVREEKLKEFFDSFFVVDFTPTSENLAEWLHLITSITMRPLDVRVSKIEWNETPKSRAVFYG